MDMQFQLKTKVFGVNKVQVERDVYCSVFTGQNPSDPTATRGLEVTKVSADPCVFDQLPNLTPGEEVEFIAILKRAAGGKSQPYFVGVVPQPTRAASNGNNGNAGQPASDKK